MEYSGKYSIFQTNRVSTYPLASRRNKVDASDLIFPSHTADLTIDMDQEAEERVKIVAHEIFDARKKAKPVLLFTGAHAIKNGLGPLFVDLVRRGVLTLIAGNGATPIHDFEIALIGQTSEYVPRALGQGRFGMAYEFSYINAAIRIGNMKKIGLGEALGKMICDDGFREEVLLHAARKGSPAGFSHPECSLLAACYSTGTPFTVHVGIGTDVIDQHPSFDGEAKGGCSGRDFLIYVEQISRLTEGGVVLNIGSAVTGPEVLLKAVSMAANVGMAPEGIVTADFDMRTYRSDEMEDESAQGYYYRDQKSIVTRIPQAFGGRGYYVQENQLKTVPFLYKEIVRLCQGGRDQYG